MIYLSSLLKGNEKISIVAGGLGESALDGAQVEALAKLPSLDELRSKLIGVLQAPATKVRRKAKEVMDSEKSLKVKRKKWKTYLYF